MKPGSNDWSSACQADGSMTLRVGSIQAVVIYKFISQLQVGSVVQCAVIYSITDFVNCLFIYIYNISLSLRVKL
jgi:hypothetical protein